MIFFFENGRLGNQLFQYCGLKKYFPGEKIIFFGCADLSKVVDDVDARFVSIDHNAKGVRPGLVRRAFKLLAKTRFIGRIYESRSGGVYDLYIKKGLIPGIHFAEKIYFQHKDFAASIDVPKIKDELITEAVRWLESKSSASLKKTPVFVHVRRGDYLYWPSKKSPAVLPLSWYKRSMEYIRQKIKDPLFIMLSDDSFYLFDVFEESDSLAISDNPLEIDMAIMSLCNHGILSASSFAWWGALYSHESTDYKSPHLYIAPKYWGGHRSTSWFPEGFQFDWITYLDAETD